MSLSLEKIDSLIQALLNNSASLIKEAKILMDHNCYARAFALAHFSREELSKVVMLQSAGTKVISGNKVDWKKLMKRFRNHTSKLELETVQASLFIGSAGEDLGKMEEIVGKAKGIAEFRSAQKNSALYVELNEGSISNPINEFEKTKAERSIALAEIAYGDQLHYLSQVGKYVDRKKISLNLPDFENMSQGELIELMKHLAPLMKKLIESRNGS